MTGHFRQRVPLRIVKASDGDPAVIARTLVHVMRRGGLERRRVADALPDAVVRRPIQRGRAGDEEPHFGLRGIDPLAFARTVAVIQRAQHGQTKTVRAHPIEIRVAPARGHCRLRQTRHFRQARERIGNRPHGAKAPVGALRAHARLRHVNNAGAQLLQHVVAQAPVVQHAGRKPFRDDVRHGDQFLDDLQPFRVPHVERDAALARIFVVELTAHVDVGHALQWRGGFFARCASALRRHRRQTRIGMRLQFDLDAFRAERRQKARAARRSEEPREVDDTYAFQRQRLAAFGKRLTGINLRIRADSRCRTLGRRHHCRRIFVQQRRATTHHPIVGGADPLARGITEFLTQFRMLDIGDATARLPVLIDGVFIGLSKRRDQQPGILHFAPREILIGEGTHKTLHRFQAFVAFATGGAGAGHIASAARRAGSLRIKALGQAVFIEYLEESLAVVRAVAQIRHHPAAIFGVHNRRRGRNAFARVAAGLARHQRTPHHPRHQIDFGRHRDRLVHRARQQLPLARAEAIQQRRYDRHAELLAGNVIGMPHLRRDRRQIVFAIRGRIVAAVHHHAAHREMNQIGTLEMRPRTIVAERRHPRDDELGEFFQQRLLIQPKLAEFALRRGFQQNIRAGDQRAELRAILLLFQIKHH